MVRRYGIASHEGEYLQLVVHVILEVENSAQTGDAHLGVSLPDEDGTRLPQVVNALGRPPTEIQLPRVVHSFVVAADEYGRDVGLPGAIVVLVEVAQLLVLLGTVHLLHIHMVAQRLEVPTDKQQVNGQPQRLLQLFDLLVDLVELAMRASLHSDLN